MPSTIGAAARAELLELAVAAATEAADLVVARRAAGGAEDHVRTKASSTDLVTAVDEASEALLRARLLGARPDDGFLGEETGESTGRSGLRWVCDPIDGTTNFVYGHAGFNVSVAAEDEHGSVVAAVVDPLQGHTFAASRGGGATRNGRPIAAGEVTDPALALCATGFAYDPARRARQGAVLAAVLPRIRDIRRMGAAAVDLCSVACGRVDAFWEKGLGPWDLAAGTLIAAEAGARVGLEAELGFVLVAGPGLFEPLRELLSGSGAADA